MLSERARYDELCEEAARNHRSELASMKRDCDERCSQLATELSQLKGEREKVHNNRGRGRDQSNTMQKCQCAQCRHVVYKLVTLLSFSASAVLW